MAVRDTNFDHLHPAIRDSVREVIAELAVRRIPLQFYEGFRTPVRQAELFARGRSGREPWASMRIVTYARPWTGPHCYGLAPDFNPFVDGRWAFKALRPEWTAALREIGKPLGLVPIITRQGKLIDPPHLQWEGWSQRECSKGIYPPGYDDMWEANLDAEIERWGFERRTVLGLVHPGAPPFVGGHPGID